MNYKDKVVVRTPLEEIWNDESIVSTQQLRWLKSDDIKELLRNGVVNFVVINVGLKPHWIAPKDCYTFWKNEVKPNLSEDVRIYLSDFPKGYCYAASEWESNSTIPLVVLHRVS